MIVCAAKVARNDLAQLEKLLHVVANKRVRDRSVHKPKAALPLRACW